MDSLLREIDHVGIAVRDLEAGIEFYRSAFNAEVVHRETVVSDGVEEALIAVAESFVQLLSPIDAESPVHRFIEKHGEGIHHVAYRVDDCAQALTQVVTAGFNAIDQTPRPGSRGTTVAFLHPHSAFGTLIELVEV